MLFIKEYYNIVKANFNNIIKKSDNRERTVKNLLKQLQIRYKKANTNLQTITKQKSILSQEYEKLTTQIENLKKKIESDFNKNKASEVFKDVDLYYSLKEKQIIVKTNIIFINNFIRRYQILNKYNSMLIENINLNQDIIIKNSYLVIPKSGTKLLKDFELLYTEDEFKKLKK
jgi:predicted nuclease with TOPRIM domain